MPGPGPFYGLTCTEDVGTWRPRQRNSRSVVHLPHFQSGRDAFSDFKSNRLHVEIFWFASFI